MGISTSTGTLTAGQSRTFNLSPASAVTLTLSPNVRVTITETPATVAATGLGGNASRVHEPRLPGTFTYGPYPMGGTVVVAVASNSGSSVAWVRSDSIIAESADGAQSLVDGGGNVRELPQDLGQTCVLAGDSIMANGYATVSNNFTNFAAEGFFNYLNAHLGSPFRVIGSTALSGTTAAHFRDTQVPAILAMVPRPKFVAVVTGHNSIYSDSQTAAATAADLISGLDTLFQNGITPIYTTVFARSFSSQALFDIHKNTNELIRAYWQSTRRGLFWDGALISFDPDTAVGAQAIRSGWTYDSAPNIHPNNLGAYWLGKYAASQISKFVSQQNILPVGASDYNTAADVYNLLSNPMFTGSSGTNGTGITGTTAPTGWSVLRVAGVPTATLAMVSITDPATGLKIANGIELTITAAAAGNEIQIINTTSIHARMAAGGTYEAECGIKVASPVNVDRVRFRVTCDSGGGESGWWGTSGQTTANYPEGFTFPGLRSRSIAAIAAPTIGSFDARIRFSAAGSAVFTVWSPRIRSV